MKYLAALAVKVIRVYQYLISPLLGNRCRFEPSCSHYAAESIQRHGLPKGTFLAGKRLLKCHPFHCGGYDPVPDSQSEKPR